MPDGNDIRMVPVRSFQAGFTDEAGIRPHRIVRNRLTAKQGFRKGVRHHTFPAPGFTGNQVCMANTAI
jgi:hypothetical protein